MERRYIESFFFLALLLGTLAVVVVMFLPFMNILILAAILAFLFSVPYERLVRALGGRRSLAALLMTLVMLVTILVPPDAAAIVRVALCEPVVGGRNDTFTVQVCRAFKPVSHAGVTMKTVG